MRTDGTTPTWTRTAATAAVAGGVVWLGKQGAIAATLEPDGSPSENLVIATLYLLGAALLVVGASGVVGLVTRSWLPALRIAAAVVLSPMIFWGVFTLADAVVDTVAGAGAHWWWASEGAIVVTAVLFGAVGGTVLAAGRRSPRIAEIRR